MLLTKLFFMIRQFNQRHCRWLLGISFIVIVFSSMHFKFSTNVKFNKYKHRESACTCSKIDLFPTDNNLMSHVTMFQSLLCSSRARRRGPHQRIISISLFGPKENKIFNYNRSIIFLKQLIDDINLIYPDNFILRVHHDDTINYRDVICPLECQYSNIDFCNMNSKLYIPPKIWRFIPAGDPLVDISMY